ncbi:MULTISPECIES: hypothetical protein [Bacillus cereus group]|uniref:Uncharacterized protein n=1 Tax=Bacillus thuringiensis TaxID=1428 RepID=A0A9X7ATP6_BACTU|nr:MULTISPECIES: hypothetical protein [Bacillus cereus group]EKS7858208.1 hypothetical protein [Bacillus cereus]MDM5370402.1 hypothetical protein [Bacillus bombysepticus]PFT50853.1 hypothetical protein COK72_02265 [Bacillus thuringiensis]PFY22890.1 hypothetical protein COL44_18585 [Bacillus toyonensis]HDR4373484.1 hypothetical protein [Bacillus cereus]
MSEAIKMIPIEIMAQGEQEVEDFKRIFGAFLSKGKEREGLIAQFKSKQMFIVKKMFDYNQLKSLKKDTTFDIYIHDFTKDCDVKDIWTMQETMKSLMDTKLDMKRLETEIKELQDEIIKRGWMRYW